MRTRRGTVYPRGPYWWYSFTSYGRRFTGTLKNGDTKLRVADVTKRKAYDALDALMGNTRRGITPTAEKVLLADLERLVLADLEARGRVSVDRVKLAYAHLKEHLAATPALQIPYTADEYVTARTKEKAKPATIRQELRWLGRGYTLAVRKGLLPNRPLLPSIEVSNARQGFLNEEQLEALVAELPAHLKALTRFAFWTAWRKAEITTLRWGSIDMEHGVARVEAANSKTRRAREFPFGQFPELAALLKQQRALTTAWERAHDAICPWVFHNDGQPIRRFYWDWQKATERAKLEGIVFHDLRRSAIRQFEIAGVPRSTAMRLSGHLTESTYTRYAISARADLEAGVAKIAALKASRAAKSG